GVVNDSFITAVSVGAEHDCLNSKLDTLGWPGLISIVAGEGSPVLIIDRDSLSVRELGKVEFGDNLVPFGGEGYGPRNHGLLGRATRSRWLCAFLIDALVLDTPFDRVRAFDEDPLHLFVDLGNNLFKPNWDPILSPI